MRTTRCRASGVTAALLLAAFVAACSGPGAGFRVIDAGRDGVPAQADLVVIQSASDDQLDALQRIGLRRVAVIEILAEAPNTRSGGLSGAPRGVSDGGLVNGLAGCRVLALVLENQTRVTADGLRGLLADHPELRRVRVRGCHALSHDDVQALMAAFSGVRFDIDARVAPPESGDVPAETELPQDD